MTASSGVPAGTLRLDLADDDSVVDAAGNPLGGAGIGNGGLTGQAYAVDTTAPTTPVLTLSDSIGNTFLSGTTAYVNTQASLSGGFTVVAAASDPDTGLGGVTFPALAGFSAGGGLDAAAPYSSAYTWSGAVAASGSQTVTATNGVGLTSSAAFTVVPDTTPPVAGSLTVEGGNAYASGTSVTVASTGFAEAQSATASGIALNAVTRAYATLAADTCGTFSSPVAVTANGTDAGLTTGCYRYTLTGSDNVGNAATVTRTVKVDTSAPPVPVLTVTDPRPDPLDNTFVSGSTIYARAGAPGQFTVTASTSDPDTGVLDVTFPALAGITGGGPDTIAPYVATYSWSGAFAAAGAQTVTARNLATAASAAAFTVVSDAVAPVGGTLTVNGGGAYNTTGTVTIASTPYTETASAAQSGLSSSVLTRQTAPLVGDTCGAYSGTVTVTGASDSVLTGNCYLYTLTGLDRVGNVATTTQTVKVDLTAPSAPTLLLSSPTGSTYLAGSTAYIRPQAGAAGGFQVDATAVDPDTDILDATFAAVPGFTAGGGTDTSPPFGTTYTWSDAVAAAGAGTRSVTVRNRALLSSPAATFSVVSDTVTPTGGVLSVNGTDATVPGSTSTSPTGSYAVTKTDFAEAPSPTASGLAGTTLTRAVGTPASGICSGFSAPAAFAGTAEAGLPLGCYRYVLTGVDNVGNALSLTTTVIAAPLRIASIVATTGTAVTVSGTAAAGGGNGRLIVCRVDTAPTCGGSNRAYRNNNVPVDGAYTWSETTTDLTGAATYYAWFTQGGTTSAVVAFPPLPYAAP